MQSPNIAPPTPHIHADALRLYQQALLTEKFYTANTFMDKEVDDVPLCEAAKDLRNNNPRIAWERTIATYPYAKQAVEEVEKAINIPGNYLSYWQIINAITWAIEYEIEGWRLIIYDYEVEFLGRKPEG